MIVISLKKLKKCLIFILFIVTFGKNILGKVVNLDLSLQEVSLGFLVFCNFWSTFCGLDVEVCNCSCHWGYCGSC